MGAWVLFYISSKLTDKIIMFIKKYFDQLLGARSTRKLVEIHNRLLMSNAEKVQPTCWKVEYMYSVFNVHKTILIENKESLDI